MCTMNYVYVLLCAIEICLKTKKIYIVVMTGTHFNVCQFLLAFHGWMDHWFYLGQGVNWTYWS